MRQAGGRAGAAPASLRIARRRRAFAVAIKEAAGRPAAPPDAPAAPRMPHNHSRGLHVGGLTLVCFSFVCVLLTCIPGFPGSTVLVEKTEIYDAFCWAGESAWETNLKWGPDLLGDDKVPCSTHPSLKRKDAVQQYCNNDEYSSAMCSSVVAIRVLSILSLLLQLCAIAFAVQTYFTPTLERKVRPSARSTAAVAASCLVTLAILFALFLSPFYDKQHFLDLGAQNIINYRGLGCVFQTPFTRGIKGLISSHPLKCLYPGPVVPLLASGVLLQLSAFFMFALLTRDTSRLLQHGRRSLAAYVWGGASPQNDSVAPLLNISNSLDVDTRRALSASLGEQARLEEDPLLSYENLSYSLHGAFMRRLGDLHPLEQRVVGLLVPMCAWANGLLFLSWFYHGLNYFVHVHAHDTNLSPEGKPIGITFVELTEMVFTFDPVTTLKDFWISGGYLLCLFMAVWLDLAPFVKITLWTWLWFVPTSEVTRGRVITWIDALGKWSMVSFFALCIISVGFMFKSTLVIPLPLPGNEGVAIDIHVQGVPGYGSAAFIVALVWSIFLGNLFLEFHVRSKHWEEFRRANAAIRPASSSSTTVANVNDTPFFMRMSPASATEATVSPGGTTRRAADSGGSTRSIPFASLLGDLVRQTSFMVMESVTGGTREHDYEHTMETLWQRYYSFPEPIGRRKFSLKGVIFVALLLVLLLLCTVIGLLVPSVRFVRSGAVAALLMGSDETTLTLNVPDMVHRVVLTGGDKGAHDLAAMYAVTGAVVPLVHMFSLIIMWLAPFTPVRQRQWFRLAEFLNAWSGLDIMVTALLVSAIGLENISSTIVEIVVPGLTAVVRGLFPQEKDVMLIKPSLEPGFAWLMVACVLEKLLAFFLLELSAISIAQRSVRARSNTERSPRQLLPSELAQFSPAARYAAVSSLPQNVFYAGLPVRGFWNLISRGGLLSERVDEDDDGEDGGGVHGR